ncbi:MAG: urease accessory protein UreF [Planctomycetota bacterium]|jgi:urease accessory protein|nr:urease accessory protein UreF [Planctomycetota bacterium]
MPEILPLLYLASPALPIGAFAWSQGLAGAIGQGTIRDADDVGTWLAGSLAHGLGRLDLPLFARCFRAARQGDAKGLAAGNASLLAGRGTAELWEEEIRLGGSLRRLLGGHGLMPDWAGGLPLGHVAAFALAAAILARSGAGEEETLSAAAEAFAWSWLENQVAAAAKALPLGQTEGGRILLTLMPAIRETVALALALPEERIGSSLPGLELASMAHERQYSRLFRS